MKAIQHIPDPCTPKGAASLFFERLTGSLRYPAMDPHYIIKG